MAKTDTTVATAAAADAVGFDPVPLLANSYDFQKLLDASEHAEGLKTEEGKRNAFSEIAKKSALLQDVIEGQAAAALPEGTVLAETVDTTGNDVTSPVNDPKASAASE